MKRWIHIAALLYPRRWRQRYGPEFAALLDDVRPTWRQFIDIVGGAIVMQLTTGASYLKFAAALAAAGAIVAFAVNTRMPPRYVSSSAIRVTADRDANAVYRRESIAKHILSRASLSEMIHRPAFNLYRAERARMPMEDVIEWMRRDLRIETPSNGPVKITFAYPDPVKARAVCREVVSRFFEENFITSRTRRELWQQIWHRDAPAGETVEVLFAPTLPNSPSTGTAPSGSPGA